MRVIDSTPEAAPALVRSTDPITSAVIGDMVMPMPMPPTMNAGSSVRYPEVSVILDSRNSDGRDQRHAGRQQPA